MSQMTAIRSRQLDQLNTAEGEPLCATSAPDWFIRPDPRFGPPYARKRAGNNVRFFTNGEDYFKDVAAAISNARHSIYISGWQINYEVRLDGDRRLWDCLAEALRKNEKPDIYLMPWLSPKAGMDTGDLETMLASFLLNAGLEQRKVWCLPAIQQSDMDQLGTFFSHHQKMVVIDNQIAYVGGIDLAYGRRDDNNFRLAADGRSERELYNPCIPPLREIPAHQQYPYMTTAELIGATLMEGDALSRVQRWIGLRLDNEHVNAVRQRKQAALNWLKDRLKGGLRLFGVGTAYTTGGALDMARFLREHLADEELRQHLPPRINQLEQDLLDWANEVEQQSGEYSQALQIRGNTLFNQWVEQSGAGAFFTWLNNTPPERLTAQALEQFSAIATPFLLYLHNTLDRMSDAQQGQPYSYLSDPAVRLLPPGGRTIDPARQPRMPWHDVQVRLEGAAVEDFSRNFIERWNSLQARFEGTTQAMPPLLAGGLGLVSRNLASQPFRPHYLPPAQPVAAQGSLFAQVLRSTPYRQLREERQGALQAHASRLPQPTEGFALPDARQANCLQAMLQAIAGAQQFIYIENQFFQSDFGEVDYATPPKDESEEAAAPPNQGEEDPWQDGPMQSLMDIEKLPDYPRYAARLGLEGRFQDNATRLQHLNFYALAEMIHNREADEFVSALLKVLNNRSLVRAVNDMQRPQPRILNTICEALATRIEAAIEMGEDFHVYMVLPVYPEGPLNDITLMTQIHLTMQSLSLGSNSLVRRIQRAMAMKAQMDSGIPEDVASDNIDKHQRRGEAWKVFEREDWKRYLTLLNLRTWEDFNGRPVTEQIYVHSKLLIADDRVAILGSANINDRSQLGDRDSELAVVISGRQAQLSQLNGCTPQPICREVQQLRIALWRKLFALDVTHEQVRVAPATQLEPMLEQPAALATWQAIQQQAMDNATAYQEAFIHIPRNHGSIWPTWPDNNSGSMPFEPAFWENPITAELPKNVAGFITELPIYWTRRENNDSGFNLSVLAHHDSNQQNTMQASVSRVSEGAT